MKFPIDMSSYKQLKLDISKEKLNDEEREQLKQNIQIGRDAIIFFTALAGAKGLGGHTGGGYDILPEFIILDSLIKGSSDIFSTVFDEAGHRVAAHYLMAALNGKMPIEKLMHYREFKNKLPGHPEKELTEGIDFSSGRLGHMWSYVNGIALANPQKRIFMLGSDGSQQEGNDAEAARFAVAKDLDVKIIIDDNNVTISDHTKNYMGGFDIEKTLKGHGMGTFIAEGEDIDQVYSNIRNMLITKGPMALVLKRKMAPGVDGIEDNPKGHDVISTENAIAYLEKKGYADAVKMIKETGKQKHEAEYLGSSEDTGKPRDDFGKAVVEILKGMNESGRKNNIIIDSDLEGSCGLHHVRKEFPELYIEGGIMERHNISAAAGFGYEKGKQGIFATFSAFSEMVNSEITMALLNESNLLAHFSHAGVDWMADNTCHYGTNIFFTDNGLMEGNNTRLYFPADSLQMKEAVKTIFNDEGLRFIFSTRSALPFILDEKGKKFFDPENGYKFVAGQDEIIRKGKDGYIVSYGEMLYRSLSAVEELKKEGKDIGLINKPTLNVVDENVMQELDGVPFVIVVESQNQKTGLGSRFGTWLLQRDFKGKYDHMGSMRGGEGGVYEQIGYQGLEAEDIKKKIISLAK